MSMNEKGPNRPFPGSRPMKKLRVIERSGIIARSWKTVAMPMSSASRGLENATGLPSTRKSPPVGRWTPESVFISVDFPAPLSPSRQSTSLALTFIETPFSATTGPKVLTMSRTSMSGGPPFATAAEEFAPCSVMLIASPSAYDPPPDQVVEQDRDQQHGAEENAEPIVRRAGEQDAHLDDAEDERAETSADDRAIAAGKKAATDHRRDDRLELLEQAAIRRRGPEFEDFAGGEHRGAKSGEHEKRDFDDADWNADIARRIGVAARGEDPIAETRSRQDDMAENGDDQRPDNDHRHAFDAWVAVGQPADDLLVGEPGKERLPDRTGEKKADECALSRLLHAADDRTVGEENRERDRKAS